VRLAIWLSSIQLAKEETLLSIIQDYSMFDMIAFDADDTLWHNETLYSAALDGLKLLLAPYASPEQVAHTLYKIEMRNLAFYGYGIKSYALSMIESAIEISAGEIDGQGVLQVIGLAKDMLQADILLFDNALEVITRLSAVYPLMVITKGDLLDQQRKLARSGLKPCFRYVEIVTDKTPESYAALLERYHIDPARFLMVGDSLRSDILPVIALGGCAVHIPYHITWAHEHIDLTNEQCQHFYKLDHLGLLPDLIESLNHPK
jgi:putative hydrolase of the HAD superfamily